jgi:hypothetical protein
MELKYLNRDNRAMTSPHNGALSVGPVSEAGKAIVSQNAVIYGLYSTKIILKDEDANLYYALQQNAIEAYQPENDVELGIALDIVDCEWRLARIKRLESAVLDSYRLDPAKKDRGIEYAAKIYSRTMLSKFSEYETRMRNSTMRLRKHLLSLQEYRRKRDASIIE